jgi:phosphatidylinositol alpha-1,6-mannosyltransferase
MTKRKGLSQFLRHSLSLITGQTTGVGLVVVGDDPTDSLNRLGEQTSIVQALEEGGEQKNVAFLGQLSDRDLQICYADAAVQIFPLVDVAGDVEGFGMVAVEAAACGTPTVAFDLGGVADAVKRENGYLVPPGDFQQFARSVLHSLDSGLPGQDSCRQFAAGFNWNIYNEKVRTELDKLLSGSTP